MEVHPLLLNSAESIYSSYITGMRDRLEFSMVITDTVQYIEVPVRATIFHCFIQKHHHHFLCTSLLPVFMFYYCYFAQQYFNALYISLVGAMQIFMRSLFEDFFKQKTLFFPVLLVWLTFFYDTAWCSCMKVIFVGPWHFPVFNRHYFFPWQ